MLTDTSINLTVSRNGLVDLLIKTQQAFQITARLMHENSPKDSIAAELVSAYLEALAASLEHDIDETLAKQLPPLVKALAQASGDEDYEHEGVVLEGQIKEFIEIIEGIRGKAEKEPLIILGDMEVVH